MKWVVVLPQHSYLLFYFEALSELGKMLGTVLGILNKILSNKNELRKLDLIIEHGILLDSNATTEEDVCDLGKIERDRLLFDTPIKIEGNKHRS